jgi:Holliday junction resolvase RusA-like endonuclease
MTVFDPFVKQPLEPKTIPFGQKQIVIGQIPSKSNSYRIVTFKPKAGSDKKGFSHLAKTTELKQYERDFLLQCRIYKNCLIDVEFELVVDVFFKRKASDVDGCLKALLDLLQESHSIKNDSLCYRILINKYIDPVNPRIEFIINPIKP